MNLLDVRLTLRNPANIRHIEVVSTSFERYGRRIRGRIDVKTTSCATETQLTQDVILTLFQRNLNVMDIRLTLKQRCVQYKVNLYCERRVSPKRLSVMQMLEVNTSCSGED